MQYNRITDLSALARMPTLAVLDVHNNAVTDLTPLIILKLSGGVLRSLDVRNNPLSDTARNVQIPWLDANGVTVESDSP